MYPFMTLDDNAEIVHSEMDKDGCADSQKSGFSKVAQKVENCMDALWDSGKWSDEKNEEILKEHMRTPYKGIFKRRYCELQKKSVFSQIYVVSQYFRNFFVTNIGLLIFFCEKI